MKGEGSRICLDCHQPIVWALTQHLRMVPIDPEPIEDGKMAITNGDPPTVRYLWHDMCAEEHEWLAICHLDTCPARPPKTRSARKAREPIRRGIDLGYTPGLLSGHPGPCAVCGQVTEKLVTDHCHRHGQARDEVCMSCNSQLAKADAAFWQGDIAEIHLAYLDHLRRCEGCSLELDHLQKP
jgi:hypothetical protein